MNEVVNGIAGRDDVELAVIARGTGWDFVRTYGIPRAIDDAVRIALDGASRTIDLGRVTYRAWAGSEAEAYFANIASAGMSGAIAQRANETTKALGGKASYLWATFAVFARWGSDDVRVSVDGEIRGGRMHDVVVANGRYFGGGMMMCPDAEPDDGLFDVLMIGDLTKRDLLADAAEDVPRQAPPPPEGGAAARRASSRSTPTRRCRSSWTASSRGRRRRASRSSRARSACGCPPRRLLGAPLGPDPEHATSTRSQDAGRIARQRAQRPACRVPDAEIAGCADADGCGSSETTALPGR